jgi:hypothetical protein
VTKPDPSAPMSLVEELAKLCAACGLCCDGSLFGRVDLAPGEVDSARKHHLTILADGKAFEQPCAALETGEAGCRCVMYEDRPRSCHRFECRLYDRHRRERGPLEPRLTVVRRVRFLVSTLQEAGFEPSDFDEARGRDARIEEARTLYDELLRTLALDFARAGDATRG